MMKSVFEINELYRELEEKINEYDPETGEFLLNGDEAKKLLQEIGDDRNQKLDNIERLKRSLKGNNEAVSAEIKRLQARKRVNDNCINRLTSLEYELTKGEEIDTGLYKFGTRKSQALIVPDDFKEELKDFINVVQSYDKKALKEALKTRDLEEFGVKLVSKTSLSVR